LPAKKKGWPVGARRSITALALLRSGSAKADTATMQRPLAGC
jgi:hypothetical protein